MPSPVSARLEVSLPIETLLRLQDRGLAGVPELERLATRGDWRARASAASALGQLIRDDPYAHRPSPFRHRIARHGQELPKLTPYNCVGHGESCALSCPWMRQISPQAMTGGDHHATECIQRTAGG